MECPIPASKEIVAFMFHVTAKYVLLQSQGPLQ
jgi:hypothetical protein